VCESFREVEGKPAIELAIQSFAIQDGIGFVVVREDSAADQR
jgi:hypothetical protein